MRFLQLRMLWKKNLKTCNSSCIIIFYTFSLSNSISPIFILDKWKVLKTEKKKLLKIKFLKVLNWLSTKRKLSLCSTMRKQQKKRRWGKFFNVLGISLSTTVMIIQRCNEIYRKKKFKLCEWSFIFWSSSMLCCELHQFTILHDENCNKIDFQFSLLKIPTIVEACSRWLEFSEISSIKGKFWKFNYFEFELLFKLF